LTTTHLCQDRGVTIAAKPWVVSDQWWQQLEPLLGVRIRLEQSRSGSSVGRA
jgi:hypothetical protein